MRLRLCGRQVRPRHRCVSEGRLRPLRTRKLRVVLRRVQHVFCGCEGPWVHVDGLRDAFGGEMPRRRQTAAPPLGRWCRLAGCAALVCVRGACSFLSRELSLGGMADSRGAPAARAGEVDSSCCAASIPVGLRFPSSSANVVDHRRCTAPSERPAESRSRGDGVCPASTPSPRQVCYCNMCP